MRARLPAVHVYTGSEDKWRQYRYLFGELGLEAVRPRLPAKREPQVDGCGPRAEQVLVTVPLDDVAELAERDRLYPLVVEDTMLFVEHFNRDYDVEQVLPGPDTKRWWRALGADGVVAVMGDTGRRRARYVCQLGVLLAPGERRAFRAEVDGTIARAVDPPVGHVDEPPGDFTRNTFFHGIFVPDTASRTLARMDQDTFLAHDYRRRCLSQAAAVIADVARSWP